MLSHSMKRPTYLYRHGSGHNKTHSRPHSSHQMSLGLCPTKPVSSQAFGAAAANLTNYWIFHVKNHLSFNRWRPSLLSRPSRLMTGSVPQRFAAD